MPKVARLQHTELKSRILFEKDKFNLKELLYIFSISHSTRYSIRLDTVAALTWVPWVPRNPWILNRLLSNAIEQDV